MRAKFQISEMLGIGLTLVVLGIGIAYGLEVMGSVKDDIAEADCEGTLFHYDSNEVACYKCPNSTFDTFAASDNTCANSSGGTGGNVSGTLQGASAEFNATNDAVTGVAKIPSKLPTIATVIVAAVVIGILITYLWGRVR